MNPSTKTAATLTTTVGLLVAAIIATAGPAMAHARVESGQSHAAFSAPPSGGVTAREERPSEFSPLAWSKLLASLAAGFEAVREPVSTLGESLVERERLPFGVGNLLPPEVVEFYNCLTEEDRRVLRDIVGRIGEFETEEQVLEVLKAKSEKLYNNAVELRTFMNEKLTALNPNAKSFIDSVVETLKALKPKGEEKPGLKLLRARANEVIEKYMALDEEAKESLKGQFPKLATGIQHFAGVFG